MKLLQRICLSFFALFCTLLIHSCGAEPKPVVAAKNPDITATISTDLGDIKVKLFTSKTPISVVNFVNLAQRGYYNGSNFHRVISGFVSQGGKHASGIATPGYTIKNETYTENPAISELKHGKAGMLAMARTSIPHSNGAQWYITHAATASLDGLYTVFGEVTEGLEIATTLKEGTKIKSVVITSDASNLLKTHQGLIKTWNMILDQSFKDLSPAQ